MRIPDTCMLWDVPMGTTPISVAARELQSPAANNLAQTNVKDRSNNTGYRILLEPGPVLSSRDMQRRRFAPTSIALSQSLDALEADGLGRMHTIQKARASRPLSYFQKTHPENVNSEKLAKYHMTAATYAQQFHLPVSPKSTVDDAVIARLQRRTSEHGSENTETQDSDAEFATSGVRPDSTAAAPPCTGSATLPAKSKKKTKTRAKTVGPTEQPSTSTGLKKKKFVVPPSTRAISSDSTRYPSSGR